MLNNFVRGVASDAAQFLSTMPCMPSGPAALLGFILLSKRSTSRTWNLISLNWQFVVLISISISGEILACHLRYWRCTGKVFASFWRPAGVLLTWADLTICGSILINYFSHYIIIKSNFSEWTDLDGGEDGDSDDKDDEGKSIFCFKILIILATNILLLWVLVVLSH